MANTVLRYFDAAPVTLRMRGLDETITQASNVVVPTVAALIGPAGDQGPEGDQGPAGNDGADGIDGALQDGEILDGGNF